MLWSDKLPKEIVAKKRIGKSAKQLDISSSRPSCPEIIEDESGNFIIIGTDVTDRVNLNATDSSLSENERAVIIPREMLISAKQDIPEK